MMIFNLIKKDILIIKKYVLMMLVAAGLIPLFMLWRVPEYAGIFGFILSAVFCVLILLQYVLLKEYQSPKASMLLCAAPFSRQMMVLSKYIFCIAIYMACCIIYAIEMVFMPALRTVNIMLFFLMFFVISVFIGIYLPVQYKLGYEKTKFALGLVIMASPFVLPQLVKMENVNLKFLSAFSPIIVCGSLLTLSLTILIISVIFSVKFYCEADLA